MRLFRAVPRWPRQENQTSRFEQSAEIQRRQSWPEAEDYRRLAGYVRGHFRSRHQATVKGRHWSSPYGGARRGLRRSSSNVLLHEKGLSGWRTELAPKIGRA